VTTELANSSINLQLRAWAKTRDFPAVKNSLTAGIFEAYSREGIEIPFPQMDINIKEIKPRGIKPAESGKHTIEKDITIQGEGHGEEGLY
jgi:small conductance mechanosensitive channel